MKKVLLTGAAGSIGYETLQVLLDKLEYDITVLDLPTKRNKKKLKKYVDKVHVVYGSVTDQKFISDLVKQQDIIIHLAAIIPPLADQQPEICRQVNFFGTSYIVETIKKFNPHCFLIYSSSVSVYGDRTEDPWITVSDSLNPSEGDYYAKTKIEAERMITSAKIHYTIFRLAGIMGRPETDPLMFHMPLYTYLEIASTKDTAYALVEATFHEKKLNHHIYNLGGGPTCRTTYKKFLTRMFDIYGLDKYYIQEKYFATKNFHCGYFTDSDKLNKILSFQRESLEDYYARLEKETKPFTKYMTKLFSKPILSYLVNHSEPYLATKKQNILLINRFFKKNK